MAGIHRDLFYGTGNLDLLFYPRRTGMVLPGLTRDLRIRHHIRRMRYRIGDISLKGLHPFISLASALAGSLPRKGERHLTGIRRVGQDGKCNDRVAYGILSRRYVPYRYQRYLLCWDSILLAVNDDETSIGEHQFERHGFYLDKPVPSEQWTHRFSNRDSP